MSEGRLAKPQLRNLHLNGVKKNLVVTIVGTAIFALAYKFLINEPYERKVEEFYKTYDAAASLEAMKAAGLMQSVPKEKIK